VAQDIKHEGMREKFFNWIMRISLLKKNKLNLFNKCLQKSYKIYTLRYIFYGVYTVEIAKLFQNGQSQAVRLPKKFRFKGEKVFIKKIGNAVVLLPIQDPWRSLLSSLDKFSSDYFAHGRNQPKQQDREDIFL